MGMTMQQAEDRIAELEREVERSQTVHVKVESILMDCGDGNIYPDPIRGVSRTFTIGTPEADLIFESVPQSKYHYGEECYTLKFIPRSDS